MLSHKNPDQDLLKTTIYLCVVAPLAYFFTYFISTSLFAGSYDTETVFNNANLKTVFTIAQLIGYVIGKLLGAVFLARINKKNRFPIYILLIMLSILPLVIFGFFDYKVQIALVFLSSIPFILIWGCVIFYIEGRAASTLIILILYLALIMASGISKTIATLLLDNGITENWMPAICALIGFITCNFFAYLLYKAKEPNADELQKRQARDACSLEEQNKFMSKYKLGLIIINILYGISSAYRSFRDYYAKEIWQELGLLNASIYSTSEVIVSVIVISIYCLLFLIKDEKKGFLVLLTLILSGGVVIIVSTLTYTFYTYNGLIWIIVTGIGLYLAYIPPGALLYDKIVAATKINYTSVFLIYISETVGTSVSLLVIVLKSLVFYNTSYVTYFSWLSYIMGVSTIVGMIVCILFFNKKIE